MLCEQTLEKMRLMKMGKMAESFKERLSRTDHKGLTHEEFVGFIIDDEYQERKSKKLASRLRCAKFKEKEACVENINYKWKRGLNKKDFLSLCQNHWVKEHQNIAFTGPTGSGKSYLAQALGNHLCRSGYTVIYERLSKLLQTLKIAKVDGSYMSKIKKILNTDVLILDDFGMSPIDEEGRQDIFELVEDRYKKGSTVITAQLPKEHWHECLGGGIVADSICDRLLHNCHFFKLSGNSCRKECLSLTQVDHLNKVP